MKTTKNTIKNGDHVTIREDERFFYCESQWNAILEVVDARVTRTGYVFTVAPVGHDLDRDVPIVMMADRFEAPASDLRVCR